MSSIRDEQDEIRNIARELTSMNVGLDIHYNDCGYSATGVTAFRVTNGESEMLWQENVCEWAHDEAYLPKLRWLRNELEQMFAAAVAEKEKVAA